MREELLKWMRRSRDPMLEALENRQSPERVQAVLEQVYGRRPDRAAKGETRARQGGRRKAKRQ